VLVGRALMTGLLAGPDPMTNERLAVHPDALGAREWWLWTRQRGVQAVALQFPMRHPGVGTVVVGASNPREIEENVAAATFPVPDEIWAEVEERMRPRA
jgi:D-threo-aldose 1-dehydrogenase